MSFNKIQLYFITIVNIVFGFIGFSNFISNIDLLSDQTFNIFDYCLIWVLNSIFSFLLILFAIYFILFIFYNCLCNLLISANDSNISFSFFGILFILLKIITYTYLFILFCNKSFCNEVSNNNLFLTSIYLNLLYPIIILLGTFIIKKFYNNSEVKDDNYRQFIDV